MCWRSFKSADCQLGVSEKHVLKRGQATALSDVQTSDLPRSNWVCLTGSDPIPIKPSRSKRWNALDAAANGRQYMIFKSYVISNCCSILFELRLQLTDSVPGATLCTSERRLLAFGETLRGADTGGQFCWSNWNRKYLSL